MTRMSGFLVLFFLTFAAVTGRPGATLAAQDQAEPDGPAFSGLKSQIDSLSKEDRQELYDFIAGNTLFVIYHEAGHMLVSELGLPVLAQEEDAVDNLATLSMLSADTDEMDLYLFHAMEGWFLQAESDQGSLVFFGAHDLDEQRGYRILCLMVGADEAAFLDLARDLNLPEDRIDSCADDFEQTADSWDLVTAPHLHKQDHPASRIAILHDPAPAPLAFLASFLKKKGLMDMVAQEIDALYDLPENVTFKAETCGEDNAFWDPDTREVVICHELLGGFAELFLQTLQENG